MIKAIIIDDEMHCRAALEMLLQEYCPYVQVLEQCNDAQAGLKAIKKLKPDLVFVDIELPHINGFEMLQQLAGISFTLIFTTEYDHYAIKAFRFTALDDLLKPIQPKELIGAMHRIRSQKPQSDAEQFQLSLKQAQVKVNHINKLAVPTLDGFELIPVDELMWCEADDNYTRLFFKTKNKTTTCHTLKEVEEQLQDFDLFIRIHHSYIVNMNEVIKYVRGEGGHVILSDGTSLNVSKSRKEVLLKKLQPNKH